MSQHRFNPQAIAKAMQPPMPGGKMLDVVIKGVLVPKENVLILPSERVRNRDDGKVEIYGRIAKQEQADGPIEVTEQEAWHVPPDELTVAIEGQQLDIANMDYVVMIQGRCITTSISDNQGRHPMRVVPLGELGRFDAQEYMSRFEPKQTIPVIS